MPCPKLNKAVAEYLQREAKAMKTPQGADHAELLETTAAEFGVDTAALTEAALDATFVRPN